MNKFKISLKIIIKIMFQAHKNLNLLIIFKVDDTTIFYNFNLF